ncbi:MAG TPA: hypothetical protein VD968_19390 [Pyrinomonadaceae bacterium]|nr:hypothetical protein [Pyrinomonadaceae bacterium]
MKLKSINRLGLAAVAALSLLLASAAPSAAQKDSKKSGGKKDGEKVKKELPPGTPVLWREHANIESLDLLLGPGGEEMKPDLSSVTFIREEEKGFSPKFRVKDGKGRVWVAKMGNEAQPETAAVRLIWAAGYATEVNYLVPCVKIPGAPHPKKGTVERCEGDGFANVRFEARPEEVKRLDEWSWTENPFVGTKELQGLLVLMALVNNWDLKDENNKILHVRSGAVGDELRYIVSDLGATFGKSPSGLLWQLKRSRNKPEDFAGQRFISEVKNGNVFFKFGGKNQKLFDDISVDEARWVGRQLSRLSDRQVADAFRAANYAPGDVDLLTRAVRARIRDLAGIGGAAASAGRR